jgi:hypothetical protein
MPLSQNHPIESFFLKVLRITITSTAAVAFAVSVCAAVYGIYASIAPEPITDASSRASQLQSMLVAEDMLKKGLVDDPQVRLDQFSFGQITKGIPRAVSQLKSAGNQKADLDEAFDRFNAFLSSAFSIKITEREKFDRLVFSSSNQVSWPKVIDPNSTFNAMWAEALSAYLGQVAQYGDNIAKNLDTATRMKIQQKLVDQTYVLDFFTENVRSFIDELKSEQQQRAAQFQALRLSQWPAYYAAGAAFAYFVTVMLIFVFVRIEIDLREIRDELTAANVGRKWVQQD